MAYIVSVAKVLKEEDNLETGGTGAEPPQG